MKRFVAHYVEMVLAMLVGMGVLGGLWMMIWPGIHDRPVLHTLEMAADMTIGMAVWMLLRGHPRRMIVEMSVAMVAPFLLLLIPLAAGLISAGTLMLVGHVLMLFTMLAAMLLRRQDYMHHHGKPVWKRRQPAHAPSAG
jgi:flagellar biosynthetic protein FliP